MISSQRQHLILSRLRTRGAVRITVPGGTTENWPWYRDLISRMGSQYARLMLGLKVRDMTSGFRVYRAGILRKVNLRSIEDNGYVFQIDMTRRVIAAGGTVVEMPIVFPERARGESKMDGSIVREAMDKVTRWGFARMHRQGSIVREAMDKVTRWGFARMHRQLHDPNEIPREITDSKRQIEDGPDEMLDDELVDEAEANID